MIGCGGGKDDYADVDDDKQVHGRSGRMTRRRRAHQKQTTRGNQVQIEAGGADIVSTRKEQFRTEARASKSKKWKFFTVFSNRQQITIKQ